MLFSVRIALCSSERRAALCMQRCAGVRVADKCPPRTSTQQRWGYEERCYKERCYKEGCYKKELLQRRVLQREVLQREAAEAHGGHTALATEQLIAYMATEGRAGNFPQEFTIFSISWGFSRCYAFRNSGK
eukprot:3030862-Pyramimonas_sp.AAC.1